MFEPMEPAAPKSDADIMFPSSTRRPADTSGAGKTAAQILFPTSSAAAPAKPETKSAVNSTKAVAAPEKSLAETMFPKSCGQPGQDAEGGQAKEDGPTPDDFADLINSDNPMEVEFGGLAKEMGLDRERVERLAEFDQRRSAAYWENQQAEWRTALYADPEFAEDVDGNTTAAREIISGYADEQLLTDLRRFGLVDHPGLVKMLAKVGKDMRGLRTRAAWDHTYGSRGR